MQVSIAMCTYNGAYYLPEQLDSFAAQNLLPEELVICDDASSDETLKILNDFSRSAPFKTRIVRNNQNLGYRRNFAQAVALCTGDIIALSDQDDIWYPNKLQRFLSVFQDDPQVDGVFSDADVIDANSRLRGRTLWDSFLFTTSDQSQFLAGGGVDQLLRRNVVTGMSFAFRAHCKVLLNSMPDSWHHDGWLAVRIALQSQLRPVKDRLAGYRVYDGQQVGTPLTLKEKLIRLKSGGFFEYLAAVRKLNLDEYRQTSAECDDLLKILESEGFRDTTAIEKIVAKQKHARRGAEALAARRLARWPIVFSNLGGYTHFSPNGLRAIPRDLMV